MRYLKTIDSFYNWLVTDYIIYVEDYLEDFHYYLERLKKLIKSSNLSEDTFFELSNDISGLSFRL